MRAYFFWTRTIDHQTQKSARIKCDDLHSPLRQIRHPPHCLYSERSAHSHHLGCARQKVANARRLHDFHDLCYPERIRAASGLNHMPAVITEDERFTMVNLRGRSTGLPMNLWLGPRGHARHAARIKVQMNHNERFDFENLAVVNLGNPPRVVEGHLSADDLEKVRRYRVEQGSDTRALAGDDRRR
jgi:hypothetical protein